jgi:hypothetical protein
MLKWLFKGYIKDQVKKEREEWNKKCVELDRRMTNSRELFNELSNHFYRIKNTYDSIDFQLLIGISGSNSRLVEAFNDHKGRLNSKINQIKARLLDPNMQEQSVLFERGFLAAMEEYMMFMTDILNFQSVMVNPLTQAIDKVGALIKEVDIEKIASDKKRLVEILEGRENPKP